MHLQLVGQPLGLGRGERLVQTGGRVRVQVVQHQHDLVGLGELLVHQRPDDPREVYARAPVRDLDVPPAQEGGAHHEQGRCAVAHVLAVLAGGPARSGGQGGPCVREELLAG